MSIFYFYPQFLSIFLSLYIDYKQISKYKQVDFSDFSVGKVYNCHGIVEIDQLVFGYDQMHMYS